MPSLMSLVFSLNSLQNWLMETPRCGGSPGGWCREEERQHRRGSSARGIPRAATTPGPAPHTHTHTHKGRGPPGSTCAPTPTLQHTHLPQVCTDTHTHTPQACTGTYTHTNTHQAEPLGSTCAPTPTLQHTHPGMHGYTHTQQVCTGTHTHTGVHGYTHTRHAWYTHTPRRERYTHTPQAEPPGCTCAPTPTLQRLPRGAPAAPALR